MRLFIGITIWIVGLIYLGYLVWPATDAAKQTNDQLLQFLTSPRQRFEVDFDIESVLKIGDPIIAFDNGISQTVGSIVAIGPQANDEINMGWTQTATVEFYAATPSIVRGDYLAYHQTPDSMDWVVQMMLPPHKRREIGALIIDAYREHQAEVSKVLQPIIMQSIRDASEVIREDFNASITAREEQISQLGNRYQEELVERELLPLVQDEIWPIVQDEIQPLATDVGEEIWKHASAWRFGWRYLYDQSPLPQRNLVRKEFNRFMDKHGIPVIEAHIPQLLEAQQRVLQRASENDRVQEVVSEAAMHVFQDPEFQTLTLDILRDVFVNNDRLTEVFERNWQSEQAQKALDITNRKLEPTITQIGQSLFGSPEESITPEFSRILRNRILLKDDRWLVLHLADDRKEELGRKERMRVISAETGTENPFHVPARKKS